VLRASLLYTERMQSTCLAAVLLFISTALVAGGCQAVQPKSRMNGESLVLAGTAPGNLLLHPVLARGLTVRSTYLPGGTVYQKGKDYVVDLNAGTIARTPGSRIADFSTNVLYGKSNFDHTKYPGYGNGPFFVYVDYASNGANPLTEKVNARKLLPRSSAALRGGGKLKIIAYGDSITAGGEASKLSLQFPARYADDLRRRFPKASITLENTATGGDTTREGLVRLADNVLSRHPDLVLIAFGMNDHNIGSVPVAEFKANLELMIERIRAATGAEIILLSCFPPNPLWHYGSHHMEDYAEATKQAAAESRAAYADVFGVWQRVLQRKDPPSLLGNNINHPNDFGHWLYVQALDALAL
jgi:lysophospholipase L1-like esterase